MNKINTKTYNTIICYVHNAYLSISLCIYLYNYINQLLFLCKRRQKVYSFKCEMRITDSRSLYK